MAVHKKKDLITEEDFTRLKLPKKKHHTQLHDELAFDDENEDTLEETLVGLEYDLDPENGEDYGADYDDEYNVDLEDMDQDETFPNEPSHHPNP